jgi:hypothetical protein
MKTLACSAILVIAFSLSAQAPTAVPVAQEPHHHLVFENSYVRVLRVSIPANESTLLHQHDASYVYVSLGPADLINAVPGKPEVHPKLTDGQVGYAKGGFAHVATAVGIPFNNVTIELLKPQGEPKNLCDKVVPSDAGACYHERRIDKFTSSPSFETDEIKVYAVELQPKIAYGDVPEAETLLVALDQAELTIQVTGKPDATLTGGTTLWLPRRKSVTVRNTADHPSRFLTINFKDSAAGTAH